MAEITLSSQAYKHNFHLISSYIRANVSTDVQIAAVLKDNAYGHGLEQMAALAKACGIKNVFVKNYAEAMRVRDDFAYITALYGMPDGDFPPHIAFVINQYAQITALPKGCKVELKVNTGMNRNGIQIEQIESYIHAILERGLELVGIFSHNGYGDDNDIAFTHTQECFESVKSQVRTLAKTYGFALPRFHSLSSSGAIRQAMIGDINDDLVRIGIALYGYLDVAFDNPISDKLQKVAALYADRITTRTLPKGSRIGYSGCTRLESQSIVSTYDIGYGDGFFRVGENDRIYTADGHQILPRMSMDCFSCMCDDDRICVFNDVSAIAKAFGTISYEILTHLAPTIKRTII